MDTRRRVTAWLGQLIGDDTGDDLIEYALLITFIALVSVAILNTLGTSVDLVFGDMATDVEASAGGS